VEFVDPVRKECVGIPPISANRRGNGWGAEVYSKAEKALKETVVLSHPSAKCANGWGTEVYCRSEEL